MNKKVTMFWIACLLVGVLYAVIQVTREETRRLEYLNQGGGIVSDLPNLGQIPNFKFISSENKTISNLDLKGKVWVLNLTYTSCEGSCSLMSHHMSKLQARYINKKNVQLLSLSIDPKNDTFDALKKYAKSYSAKSPTWQFITGTQSEVQSFTTELKLPVNFKTMKMSTRFVLIDSNSIIRGYFDSQKKSGMEILNSSIGLLLNEISKNPN